MKMRGIRLKEMEEQIERTRLLLYHAINENDDNLRDPCVIAYSKLLDELILDYIHASKGKKRCKKGTSCA
jgi:hypothetical protein